MPTPTDYEAFKFDPKSNDGSYTNQNGENNAVEYGQVNPESTRPDPKQKNYPNVFGCGYDSANRMFSQDKGNEPIDLARETAGSQSNFADLQQHLNNSLDVAGGRVAHDRTKRWESPTRRIACLIQATNIPIRWQQRYSCLRYLSMKTIAVVLILSCVAFGQHIQASKADVGNVNAGVVNSVYYPAMCGTTFAPTWCSGSDMGAWVNAAAANCPDNGACRIHIAASPSCFSFSTPIVFGLGKFVTLEGDPSQGSCIKYTPTTGTAITFDPGNPDRSTYGIRDLQLIGPGNGTSTTGVSLGPTNGGNAINIMGFRTGSNCCSHDGFGTGITIGSSFLVTIQTSAITGNGVGIATTNFVENLRLIGNTISANTTNPILLNATGWTDVYSLGNSYDDNSGPISLPTTSGVGNHLNSSGDHFENPSLGAGAQPYITVASNSHVTISGGVMLDDRASSTNTGMINCSGASIVYIYGMARASNGITVNPFLNASGTCRAWLEFSQSTGTFTDVSSAYTGSVFDSNFTFSGTPSFALANGHGGATTVLPYGSNVTTGITGNMPTTQIGATTTTAGIYLVCIAMFPTATGSATAIQATVTGNANGTAFTVNIGSVLSLAAAGNIGGGCLPIPMGTANINVATTGYSGTGTYTVRSIVEEIQ